MNKSEAIARIARLPGAAGLRVAAFTSRTLIPQRTCGGFDIPVAKLSEAGNSNISLLLLRSQGWQTPLISMFRKVTSEIIKCDLSLEL